jgi:hypothetical protein
LKYQISLVRRLLLLYPLFNSLQISFVSSFLSFDMINVVLHTQNIQTHTQLIDSINIQNNNILSDKQKIEISLVFFLLFQNMTINIEKRPDRINWLSLLNYILTKKKRKLSWHIHIYIATHLLLISKYNEERERERRQPFRTGFDTHQRLFDQKLKSFIFRLNDHCHIFKTKKKDFSFFFLTFSHWSLNIEMNLDMIYLVL